MALVPGRVVTLHHAVPLTQSLVLPVDAPIGIGVTVGSPLGLLADDGSLTNVGVTVGNLTGVQHVVVPASVLDHGAATVL